MAKTAKKKPGRPAEFEDRTTLSCRLESDIYEKVKRAADEGGRSIAVELAKRIRQSFADEHNAATQEDVIRALEAQCDKYMDRAEELQMLLDNIKNVMQQAVRDALIDAGLTKNSK